MKAIDPKVDGKSICNRLFQGPKDMVSPDGVGCEDLRIFATSTGELVSFWKPNEEELAAINAGQAITLTLWGGVTPCYVGVTEGIDVSKKKKGGK